MEKVYSYYKNSKKFAECKIILDENMENMFQELIYIDKKLLKKYKFDKDTFLVNELECNTETVLGKTQICLYKKSSVEYLLNTDKNERTLLYNGEMFVYEQMLFMFPHLENKLQNRDNLFGCGLLNIDNKSIINYKIKKLDDSIYKIVTPDLAQCIYKDNLLVSYKNKILGINILLE